jgi:hypothetical protein
MGIFSTFLNSLKCLDGIKMVIFKNNIEIIFIIEHIYFKLALKIFNSIDFSIIICYTVWVFNDDIFNRFIN